MPVDHLRSSGEPWAGALLTSEERNVGAARAEVVSYKLRKGQRDLAALGTRKGEASPEFAG